MSSTKTPKLSVYPASNGGGGVEGRRSSNAELYDGGHIITCLRGMVPMIISVEICTLPPQFGSTENYNKERIWIIFRPLLIFELSGKC